MGRRREDFEDRMYYPYIPFSMPDVTSEAEDLEDDFRTDRKRRQADPPPILSNERPRIRIFLRKELTGYPNYGNPSGNADILYTGNEGAWTFNLPPNLFAIVNNADRVRLIIRGALDDHYDVPENRYRMNVSFNRDRVFEGRTPFVHGRPRGQQFNNWQELEIDLPRRILRLNNQLVIRNTSNTGPEDFIAFDWIELRFQG